MVAAISRSGFTIADSLVLARVGYGYDASIGLYGAKGKFSASIPAVVSALNSVDFPTLGSPTMPHLMPMMFSLSINRAFAGWFNTV